VAQIGEIGAEMKAFAKSITKSNYVRDKRKVDATEQADRGMRPQDSQNE